MTETEVLVYLFICYAFILGLIAYFKPADHTALSGDCSTDPDCVSYDRSDPL